MRIVRSRMGLVAIAAGLVLGLGSASSASEKGKQLYIKHGCWQCHGTLGQGGGVAGPAIVPNVMPLEAMANFIRNSSRAMPPYREAILSNADLAEIHAYLTSVPKSPDPKSIPLLNQ